MGFINTTTNTSINNSLKEFLYDVAGNEGLKELDFFNKLMEYDDNPNDIASSEASYVFIGPPTLKQRNSSQSIVTYLTALGGIQQFSPSENRQVIPTGELGSKLKRVISGPTQYSLQLSRILTRHSNLKQALYRWLSKLPGGDKDIDMVRIPGSSKQAYFSGLESEIYGIPFGVLSVSCTANGTLIGADYLERCYIMNFGSPRQASNAMIIENASLYVTRVLPFMFYNKSDGYINEANLSSTPQDSNGLIQYSFAGEGTTSASNTSGSSS